MSAAHLPLSLVVITLNEARRIGDCLESVRGLTTDLVVVDAGSEDDTGKICDAAGARFLNRRWTGYSEQKNYGNSKARHDWILSLDADERLTPEAVANIIAEFSAGPRAGAYEFRFRNHLGSRRIRFGAWNPEYHVRLFDRRVVAWNQSEVHEGLAGLDRISVRRLQGDVLHFTVASTTELADKSDRYAQLFAGKLRRSHQNVPAWKIWLNPGLRFLRDYLLRFGFLDGLAGAAIAWESARYTHLKYRWALPDHGRELRAGWLFGAGATALLCAGLWINLAISPSSYRERPGAGKVPITVSAVIRESEHDDDESAPQLPRINEEEVVI